MANVVVLGVGFAGVVAAESLARRLGPEHRITLVSRHREFTFFPSLVRLAFGRLKLEDVFFDLSHATRSQRIALTQAEVADYDPDKRYVVVRRGRLGQFRQGKPGRQRRWLVGRRQPPGPIAPQHVNELKPGNGRGTGPGRGTSNGGTSRRVLVRV